MSRHRIYFDESGVHSYGRMNNVHERYLALCGVIFEQAEYIKFQTDWESMKRRHFRSDPDEPVILHRKELLSKRGVFSALENEAARLAFDEEFLSILKISQFTSIIVVIDKVKHEQHYRTPINPYHICLYALIQRYCFWLGSRTGDVMGEARGRVEDSQLKAAYASMYNGGDFKQRPEFYQKHLTSKDIKLLPKSKNTAGLQLADLLAHPSKLRCLSNCQVPGITESKFGKKVADVFWTKIRRNPNGESKGWGEVYI